MNIDRSVVCPICRLEYRAYPAVSRKGGTTEICPDCGTREALEDFGFDTNKIEEYMAEIHRLQRENTKCLN